MTMAWPTNLPRTLDYPHVGADAILAGAARAYGDRLAIRDGDETMTFRELNDHALRAAAGLRAQGIVPGDTIALHMSNSIWFVVAYYGALCTGAAVAPINPAQPVEALREQLESCAARAVISHPAHVGRILEAGASTVRTTICIPVSHAAPGPAADSRPPSVVPFTDLLASERLTDYRVDPELTAHLQLTGGTTGRSKAVRVLHRNLVANVLQVCCWRSGSVPTVDADGGITVTPVASAVTPHSMVPGDVVQIAVAPLFHGLGLVGYQIGLMAGATMVMTGRFDPEELLRDIEEFKVTDMAGSPAMYYALLRSPSIATRDLSSVRLIGCGSAPIDTTALGRLAQAFHRSYIAEGYGLSEATMGVTLPPISASVPLGAVGVPVFDTEIEIRAEDAVTVLRPGEPGDVWVRGPQVADGYLGEPELSAAQFVDAWLHTGDIGKLDEDGYLYLLGRSKDMLIYKGYNVYPQPLEEILCSHPAVAQASVIGLPDRDAGEIPVAFVVPGPGADAERAAGDGFAEELMAFVAERVAPYQRIRALHVIDALPITATGKVQKNELRRRVEVASSLVEQ